MNLLSSAVRITALTLAAASLAPLFAQTPPAAPAGPANLISNGGFERNSAQDNLWDGVDSEGYLAGRRLGLEALAESGSFRTIAMPVSVTAGDLNGDGLVDILIADPYGYLQAYFNSGSKTDPVFTHSEQVPVYLSSAPANIRKSPRVNLYDWSRRGMLDLTVGDYNGEVFFIANTGSATVPDFRQPADVEKAATPTAKGNQLWANLVTPAAFDFNKDGKTDLALGEGSYSANSIHLLLNEGSNNQPKFDEAGRSYLAYGDGREHLTPTVVDYNGDGAMDIIASNRDGKVGVYLNPGSNWKPGGEFKFSTDIKFGAVDNLGGLVSVFAADLNGDGLFDLIIGKTNGRIALATNIGTKTEPKFAAPLDLKGTDIWGRNIRIPAGWATDTGLERGNFSSSATCFGEEDEPKIAPPEGKFCLKIGYFASQNKFFKLSNYISPGNPTVQNLWFGGLEATSVKLPGNVFLLSKALPDLKLGSTYTLSFKTKGESSSALKYTLGWRGTKKLAADKVESGDRGSKSITKFEANENKEITGTFNASSAWTTTTKTFTLEKFKDKNLGDLVKASAILEFRGTLTPATGAVYFDDVELIEKK